VSGLEFILSLPRQLNGGSNRFGGYIVQNCDRIGGFMVRYCERCQLEVTGL